MSEAAQPMSVAIVGAGQAGFQVAASLREALTGAAPLVKTAGEAMTTAVGSVEERRYPAALSAEGRTIAALADAQELFFDLRELLLPEDEEETPDEEEHEEAEAKDEVPPTQASASADDVGAEPFQ